MNKKHLSRYLSMLLVIVMSFSLIACSSKSMLLSEKTSENSSTQATKEQTSSVADPDNNPTEPTTKEPSTEKPTEVIDEGYKRPTNVGVGTLGSEDFTKFCTEYFTKAVTKDLIDFHYYVDNPSNFGITEYNKGFSKVELEKIGDTSELRADLEKLKEFNYSALTTTQQQTFDVIYEAITTSIDGAKYELYDFTFGESNGIQSQLPIFLAEYTLKSANDVDEYLNLLTDIDRYFKDLIALENKRVEAGLAMSVPLIEGTIKQCETFIENPESNYLIDTFNARINTVDWLTEEQKNSYIATNKTKVLENVIPAYENLITELTKIKDSGKCPQEGGITNFKDYKGYFEYILKDTIGTDKTPDEVNSLLKKYYTSSITAFTILYSKDASIIEKMESPSYAYENPEEILSHLQTKIEKDFPKYPECTTVFHTVHPSLSEFLAPAFYISSPVDNFKLQNIYINNGAENSISGLYTTIAHEGFPGHLYQHLYYANTKHEYIRDIVSWTGYAEGWATYIEMKAYGFGLEDENLASALVANNIATLSIYGQMDLGVNYYNWDKAKLKSFVKKNFGVDDDETINSIYNTLTECPGNYLNYAFGYIEMTELKNDLQKNLGDNFNEKEFHKYILEFGNAPYYIIRSWMKKEMYQ